MTEIYTGAGRRSTLTLRNPAAACARLAACPEAQAMIDAKAAAEKEAARLQAFQREVVILKNHLRPFSPYVAWRVRELRETLHALYPSTFAGFQQPKPPVKLGIYEDILARGAVSELYLGSALKDYTGGKRYLAGVIEGATRVDLDGNPAGTVSAEAAGLAAGRLAKIIGREAALAERVAQLKQGARK